MDDIIQELIRLIGIDTATALGVLAFISAIARLIGKAIPDSAVGPAAIVRKIAKVIGLYTSNRIEPGLTTTEAARTAIQITGISARRGGRNVHR